MPQVHRFALVAYTPEQMFALVRDVARYPEFLPWVQAAEVHEDAEDRQVATLDVRVAGIARRFTTENLLVPDQSLSMRLKNGPFDELAGRWEFKALGQEGARVSLDLRFSLPGSVWMTPFQRGFERVADRMVDDFCRRAERIHG
ncbi:type II toxin-antitoxin system RatA family toxin [Wenzhouxiangella marina]|uniref:Cyclase/dehydrase n=1 Tax=Wenzhouxiangella marina TaxID=1579979 RepID=A0A0K0XX69_9GAMM|nr:type II toxin-antitoxin system RatA family toxin [Wenzhouxiangella marina]AKS42206.1 Cyclase/dehydrase [Wenzhouxiangella marina]MBB6086022.1 ribosome-associated toxin RatA of RatAB toxin-antitoxin module [Wenzhouxiangella marina]